MKQISMVFIGCFICLVSHCLVGAKTWLPQPTMHSKEILSLSKHKLKPQRFPCGDTIDMLYFIDTINSYNVSIYQKTEISLFKMGDRPHQLSADKFNEVCSHNFVVLINDSLQYPLTIPDFLILDPISIMNFRFNGFDYFVVDFMLASSIPGSYWYHLVIKTDPISGKTSFYELETQRNFEERDLSSDSNGQLWVLLREIVKAKKANDVSKLQLEEKQIFLLAK